MATSKKRINIILSEDIEASLEKLAIEIDEDDILNAVAENRETKDAKFLKHNQVW